MSDFQDYLTYLNQASIDTNDNAEVTSRLGDIALRLEQAGATDEARQARLNQEVLATSKSLTQGVSYQFSFTQTDEHGTEREFGWPDTTGYGAVEYDYVQRRYQTTRNLYLKSEYGLFLYLRKQLRTNEAVRELADTFFRLGDTYWRQQAVAGGQGHYALHALEALQRAFHLANARKNDPQVADLLRAIVDYLVQQHGTWKVQDDATLLVLARITGLFTEHFKALSAPAQAHAILAQDWRGAHQLAQTYRQGAIELAGLASELAAKAGRDRTDWAVFQAQQYELLAREAEQQRNLTAVHFTEQALRIYRRLRDVANGARLEAEYQRRRTAFSLTKTSTPLPEEAAQQLTHYIDTTVAQRDAQGILAELSMTPMFHSLEQVAEAAQAQRNSLSAILPSLITDKHGNPVQRFSTAEEKAQFQFLSTYGLLAQLATQTLVKLMLEAYKADKLHAASIAEYLGRSWLGKPRWVESAGEREQTHPARLLMSGVRALFRELDAWRQEPDYEPDFIASTDSLTLKVEYLLRYICAQLSIPTFKLREGTDVIMEKLLDELLADLKGRLEEEDRFFIKFFLSEKAGQNLRNRVAHGLLDDTEYGIEKPFLVLTMILKLASYEFSASA